MNAARSLRQSRHAFHPSGSHPGSSLPSAPKRLARPKSAGHLRSSGTDQLQGREDDPHATLRGVLSVSKVGGKAESRSPNEMGFLSADVVAKVRQHSARLDAIEHSLQLLQISPKRVLLEEASPESEVTMPLPEETILSDPTDGAHMTEAIQAMRRQLAELEESMACKVQTVRHEFQDERTAWEREMQALRFAVSGATRDATPRNVVSSAAALTLWEDGTPWAEKQGEAMSRADWVVDHLLPLCRHPLVFQEKPFQKMQAARLAQSNVDTNVLATLAIPAWRVTWALGIVTKIVSAYPLCKQLIMVAVKGGPATDCEIRFVEHVMPLLGFSVATHTVEQHAAARHWQWRIERPNASPYVVTMLQWYDPRHVSITSTLVSMLTPYLERAAAPHLIRVVVASSPLLNTHGESVHAILNNTINAALQQAVQEAEASPAWSLADTLKDTPDTTMPLGPRFLSNSEQTRQLLGPHDNRFPETQTRQLLVGSGQQEFP